MKAFSTVRFECLSGYIAPKSFTFGIMPSVGIDDS